MAPKKNPDSDNLEIAQRLRQAVERFGGAAAVSDAAKVPFSSIHEYMKGTDLKFSRAAHLAQVCGFSLDWLATGSESEKTDEKSENYVFGRDMMESPVNFSVLLILIRSCQAAFFGSEKPTLRSVFEWVSPSYRHGHKLPEVRIEFKSGDDLK